MIRSTLLNESNVFLDPYEGLGVQLQTSDENSVRTSKPIIEPFLNSFDRVNISFRHTNLFRVQQNQQNESL